MDSALLVFIGITILFFLFLILQHFFHKKFCAICAAVSCSWLLFMILSYRGLFQNQILLALLVGQTTVGIFYLLEKKMKEKNLLFRLPILLSLTFLGYSFFSFPDKNSIVTIIFLAVLWILFLIIYLWRTSQTFKSFADKIIACCKNW